MIAVLAAVLLQAADTTRPCVVVIDQAARTTIRDIGGGVYNRFVGGGFAAHCRDDPSTRLRSDSAAHYALLNRLELIGRVRIDDPSLLLVANMVTYLIRNERLIAQGDVDATNRRTNTRIRGPRLEYLRPIAGIRDTAETYAPSRPTIDYYPTRAASDTAPPEPYLVVGDRVRMRGDDRLWAGGRVTIDRSDFAARGDSMWLDFTSGRGELLREPSIETRGGDSVTLRGRRIELGLDERKLTSLIAFADGIVTGEAFTLTGDTLHLAFETGELHHVDAWGDTLARVAAERYDISADSLAIDTPGEVLTEVRGYGRALAVTTSADTTRAEPDWLAGDTVHAFFRSVADSAGTTETELDRVIAWSNAKAYYLTYDDENPEAPPGFSYVRGDRITIAFDAEGVERVDIEGAADGVYGRPARTPDRGGSR